MSRVYQKPATSTIRRAPVRPTGGSTNRGAHVSTQNQTVRPQGNTQRSVRPTVNSTNRGGHVPTQGRTMRPQGNTNHLSQENQQTNLQERTTTTTTTHVGDGFHMITPSMTKREQIMRQAEDEQRQYEAHIERTRLRNIHEVHRLGGDDLTEDEVRRRQADKYRREKYTRLEKIHQDQIQQKQNEEREINTRKQIARQQTLENEEHDQGACGWTNEAREEDRQKTMDQFLNRLTQQYQNINISSDEAQTKSEKLAILHETLPHIDESTLENYLEIYNGDIDRIVSAFLD